MYHHVFTEREKSRRNKTIIEKKATIIVKKKRQHAITSLSHRCHGFQVLVLPSPQDRAPAPIHALTCTAQPIPPSLYPTRALMTTQPTQPRPPNIAHRPNRKAPFADRLRRRAIVKTMCTLGMSFKAGLTALTWSTVDPRRTRETIVLLEISRSAPYSLLTR